MLLGDLVFRLQHTRNDDWELGDQCFVFYKVKPLVDQYERFWMKSKHSALPPCKGRFLCSASRTGRTPFSVSGAPIRPPLARIKCATVNLQVACLAEGQRRGSLVAI